MNANTSMERENDPLLRQATTWALELSDPTTPLERIAEWQSWLGADVRHRDAFARIEEVLGLAEHVRHVQWPDKQELAADRYDASRPVSEHLAKPLQRSLAARSGSPQALSRTGGARRPPSSTRRRFVIPASLAATVVLGVGLFIAGFPREINVGNLMTYKRVQTPAGGTLKVMLADGSSVDVGGESSLSSIFTRRSRTLTLEQGEAFFRVAKDTERPFIVRAGSSSIIALGTAFNVRRTGERITVSVAEGRVKVDASSRSPDGVPEARELTAGQQASIEAHGAQLVVASIDASAVAGWRDGRLRYLNEPLASVIVDVERYTGREIELGERGIGELRITGTVLEHNLEGWLTSLEETFPLRAQRLPNGSIKIETVKPLDRENAAR